MTWIYALPSYFVAIVAVLVISATALGGLAAFRSIARNDLISHNEVAGAVLATLGTILAVMLSFMVVTVWQEFDAAGAGVESEASAAADLHHLADLFDARSRMLVKHQVDDYVRLTVAEEWPAMVHGGSSAVAQHAVYQLYSDVGQFHPTTPAQTEIQGQAIRMVTALVDGRRSRLEENRTGIPPILWFTMLFLGSVTLIFSYYFRVQNLTAHCVMVVALSSVVAVMFVLIAELDYPFRGDISIQPTAFLDILARVHGRAL